MNMPITLRDVAARCGLSKQTVGFVLGGRAHLLRPETRERVRRAADELGYRPNAAARAISTGRFATVALVLGTAAHRSPLPPGLLEGIADALSARDLTLTLVRLPDEVLGDERAMPRLMRERSVDGVLVKYESGIPPRVAATVRALGVPAVWINAPGARDRVRLDDTGGARAAVERFVELGHRRIAYVDWVWNVDDPDVHYSIRERRTAYEAAMRRAGLRPRADCVQDGMRLCGGMLARARALLRDPDRPTAILAHGEDEAGYLAHAAQLEGLALPLDLSLVAFGYDGARLDDLRLGVLDHPQAEVGAASVAMLVAKLAAPSRPIPSLALPFRLIEAGTVAPPRQSA